MFKLSAYIAKLEDRWGKKLGRLWEKHKGKWKLYLPLGLSGWCFYGMLINSIRLGTRATFNQTGEAVDSIWVVNPFRNLLAVFSPTGLAVTLVGALLVCLIAKKGYIWFSGYKYIHDKRGFDILPDGTHGTSGFMSRKEQARIVLTGSIKELDRTLLGKQKDAPDDDDKYAEYVTLRPGSGKKVWWKCPEGHEWEAVIANRTKRRSGCPFCAGNMAKGKAVEWAACAMRKEAELGRVEELRLREEIQKKEKKPELSVRV